MAFISPSFLKNSLTGCRICVWQLFSVSLWKVFCFLLALVISDERATVMWVSVPYSNALSLSSFFKMFFFAYNFQQFIYNGFMDILGFILLGVCSTPWVCVFVLFTKFGKLSPNIYLNSLSVPVSLPLLLRLLQLECSASVIVPPIPEALFIFSSLFTLNCLGQLNSIDPSLILSALYSVVSTLLLSPPNNWFFLVCVVICLFLSLLITSISLLRFSIFYFFREDFQ